TPRRSRKQPVIGDRAIGDRRLGDRRSAIAMLDHIFARHGASRNRPSASASCTMAARLAEDSRANGWISMSTDLPFVLGNPPAPMPDHLLKSLTVAGPYAARKRRSTARFAVSSVGFGCGGSH